MPETLINEVEESKQDLSCRLTIFVHLRRAGQLLLHNLLSTSYQSFISILFLLPSNFRRRLSIPQPALPLQSLGRVESSLYAVFPHPGLPFVIQLALPCPALPAPLPSPSACEFQSGYSPSRRNDPIRKYIGLPTSIIIHPHDGGLRAHTPPDPANSVPTSEPRM